jgi:hypothetical protein
MNKIIFLILIFLSMQSYANNKQYLNEFDQYLIYVKVLQKSNNNEITIDANLISEALVNRLRIKARINKKSLKIINSEKDKFLTKT